MFVTMFAFLTLPFFETVLQYKFALRSYLSKDSMDVFKLMLIRKHGVLGKFMLTFIIRS